MADHWNMIEKQIVFLQNMKHPMSFSICKKFKNTFCERIHLLFIMQQLDNP